MIDYIAFYLPQFHEVLENNLWWGSGFTEWTNVKNASALFYNHRQPRIPLNNNYYDLLNIETLIFQSKLANQYNIHSFAFYHYWFEGRLILEKPSQLLLSNPQIKQNFCFFWANHDWKKSWDGSSKLLIKQNYGLKSDWINHFNYLLPFFKDNRYIKINNKPIFGLFKGFDIPNRDEMYVFWNQLALENGFNGIFIIESVFSLKNPKISKFSDAIVLREPDLSIQMLDKFVLGKRKIGRFLNRIFKIPFVWNLSFKHLAKKSTLSYIQANYLLKSDKKIFPSVFTGWDNTPRHKNRGFIIDSSPDNFKQYLNNIQSLSIDFDNNFIFINAWNEWGEGMYLEPDTVNGFKYLEAFNNK
jgi:hypothetical protein